MQVSLKCWPWSKKDRFNEMLVKLLECVGILDDTIHVHIYTIKKTRLPRTNRVQQKVSEVTKMQVDKNDLAPVLLYWQRKVA